MRSSQVSKLEREVLQPQQESGLVSFKAPKVDLNKHVTSCHIEDAANQPSSQICFEKTISKVGDEHVVQSISQFVHNNIQSFQVSEQEENNHFPLPGPAPLWSTNCVSVELQAPRVESLKWTRCSFVPVRGGCPGRARHRRQRWSGWGVE